MTTVGLVGRRRFLLAEYNCLMMIVTDARRNAPLKKPIVNLLGSPETVGFKLTCHPRSATSSDAFHLNRAIFRRASDTGMMYRARAAKRNLPPYPLKCDRHVISTAGRNLKRSEGLHSPSLSRRNPLNFNRAFFWRYRIPLNRFSPNQHHFGLKPIQRSYLQTTG